MTVSKEEVIERWQLIETAERDGSGPLWGYQDGVQFSMIWRLPAWFEFSGHEPREAGAWVGFVYGLICYDGDGKLIELNPTHWMPRQPIPNHPRED